MSVSHPKLVLELTHSSAELFDVAAGSDRELDANGGDRPLAETFDHYVRESAARCAGLRSELRSDAEAVRKALEALGYTGD